MMHWAMKYMGRAWQRAEHDCWGFFRTVQREQFGRDIPQVTVSDYRALTKAKLLETHPHRLAWREISREELQEGDGVRMSSAKNPGHVGVWIDTDGGRVLHCDEPFGVMATSLGGILDQFSDVRFYRFEGDQCPR